MRRAFPLLALGLAAVAGSAWAQTPSADDRLNHIVETYDACTSKAVTNPDFSICGGARTEADEALLNAVWKTAYGNVKDASKAALLTEQRLWVAFKDKSCLWLLDGYGREGQVIDYPMCRASVIEDRIRALADQEVR
jgi:uncharacterized protein YecT (DUF1311 family)